MSTIIIAAAPRFPLGQVVMTPGLRDTFSPEQIAEAIQRHSKGDWGDVCKADAKENELSLKQGHRLLSVNTFGEERLWVITERIKALREANTVEAAPERTVRKATRAERPVTARIRERMAEEPVHVAPEPAAVEVKPEPGQLPEEPPAAPPAAVIAMPEPFRPVNGHAKAVAKTEAGERGATTGVLNLAMLKWAANGNAGRCVRGKMDAQPVH